MYSVGQVCRGVRNPNKAKRELNRRVSNLKTDIRAWHRFSHQRDQWDDFMAEDWDTLFLLDACRADELRKSNPFDAPVETRTSPASFTIGFFRGMFDGREFPDTVLVCSNPNIVTVDSGFAAVYHAWDSIWDDEEYTVHPEAMTDLVIEAHAKHPDKRVLAHYVQPHSPYIGPSGEKIPTRGFTGGEIDRDDPNATMKPTFEQARDGDISIELLRQAYRENLEIVLSECVRARGEIQGKIVISADHGEAFGEQGVFGHPRWEHIPSLVEVPWLVLDGERRDIRSATTTVSTGEGAGSGQRTDEGVEEKLAALGYMD